MNDYTAAYYEMLFEENSLENLYTEKLITFGNKAYPKYGNVVIMAGGGGSGKGFQIANMLGIDAKVLDIDMLKEFILKSKYFQKEILERFNVDIFKLSLNNAEHTKLIHSIIRDLKLIPKYTNTILNNIKNVIEKPNLIFDKTCSSLKDILEVSNSVQDVGYDIKNIHLVWVLTKYETALIQNQQRSRQIPDDILLVTHIGTASVFNTILTEPTVLNNYLNGDIFISFNQAGIGTHVKLTNTNKLYVTDFDYIQIKEQGKPIMPVSKINQEIFDKIAEYVPSQPIKYTWQHIKDFSKD